MQRKIVWLKWSDPLAHLVYDREDEEPDEEEEEDVTYEEARNTFSQADEPDYKQGPRRGQLGPAIVSPMGVIPLRESNLPSKLFNFWTGHTNFGLTGQIQATIEAVPGVETLDVFTRYRFRLGVGKAFDQNEVKLAVETAVCREPTILSAHRERLDMVKAMLRRRHPHWAIYVMHDGRVQLAGGLTPDEVRVKGSGWEGQAKEIVTSW